MKSITLTRRISSISKREPKTKRPNDSMRGPTLPVDEKAKSINKQILKLGRDGKWKDILVLYKEEKQHFNAVNHATVMSQLGRIRQMRNDDALFEAFLDDLSAKLYSSGIAWIAEVRALASIVHAIAKMGLKPNASAMKIVRLVDDCETAQWFIDNGNPQDIANCVWACGKLGIEASDMFRLLDHRAEWLVENGNPQDLANCLWACATLGIESPNLFRLLDERAEWLVDNGTPQALANCVGACGTLGIKSPNLFRLLDKRAQWLLDILNTHEVEIYVWACGKLEIESPNLFKLLDERTEWW